MESPKETFDLLALRPMPELAAALRQRLDRIIERWTAAVQTHLPDADPLTTRQVRDSIPTILEKIALALESADVKATEVLEEVGEAHGIARFQERYNIEEVLIEYRLLRRVMFEEIYSASGFNLTFMDAVPVNMGVDTAMHKGVANYVRHLIEQLQSAARAESKYLSFLSHDLRNNLNGVTLTLDTLEQSLSGLESTDAIEDIRHLRRAVFQTIEGMDRLLQAERLRKHAVTLKLSPVLLHNLVDEALAQQSGVASEKGIKLENAVPVNAAAHSDRELVMLTLQNLLGNAVKFSSHGTVRVSAISDTLGWKVSISDQGPGIAPERVASLFEAFSRGETHGQPGMGLGLTIASHAARLLGSELQVESKLGEGTTFSLKLPPAKPENAR